MQLFSVQSARLFLCQIIMPWETARVALSKQVCSCEQSVQVTASLLLTVPLGNLGPEFCYALELQFIKVSILSQF